MLSYIAGEIEKSLVTRDLQLFQSRRLDIDNLNCSMKWNELLQKRFQKAYCSCPGGRGGWVKERDSSDFGSKLKCERNVILSDELLECFGNKCDSALEKGA